MKATIIDSRDQVLGIDRDRLVPGHMYFCHTNKELCIATDTDGITYLDDGTLINYAGLDNYEFTAVNCKIEIIDNA